jgi:type I restriction-modification system DNA methylase subunit
MEKNNLVSIVVKSQNILRDNEGLTHADAFDEVIKILYTQYHLDADMFVKIEYFRKYYKENIFSQDMFNTSDIKVSDSSIRQILSLYLDIDFSEEDVKGRLFEIYLGRTFTSGLGQFFTPRNVVKFLAKYILNNISDKDNLKILDPSCGSGGMLSIMHNMTNDSEIIGYDIDNRLVRTSNINLDINNCKNYNIINKSFLTTEYENYFDIVISNPPFGIKESKKNILSKYFLSKNKKSQDLEILFIEQIIKSLKPNGICGIVLPDGIFNNKSTKYVRRYLLENTNLIASIGLPDGVFKSSGTGCETSLLIFKKLPSEITKCKMYLPSFIGYETKTKFAKKIDKNDLDLILNETFPYIIIDRSDLLTRCDAKYFTFQSNIKNNFDNDLINLNSFYDVVTTSKSDLDNFLKNKEYIKYIQYSDIDDFFGYIRNVEEFEVSDLPNRAKQIVKKGDVIIPRLTGSSGNKMAIITDEYDNCLVSSGFFVLRPKNNYESEFIFSIFRTKFIQEQMNSISSGTIMPSVDDEYFHKLLTPPFNDEDISNLSELTKSEFYFLNEAKKSIMNINHFHSI